MSLAKQATIITLAVFLVALAATESKANPQGPTVVHGQASFARPNPHTLNITNSPQSIINWAKFSIQPNELTRFIQQSPASAILNRVTGGDPSAILGSLLSNGRVFLINANGIVFGPNSVVDTAGLIASTLGMSDEDFIAGNLRFQGENAGAIENFGYIKAGRNGDILLLAPNIENSGIIETDGGHVILAAGERVTIASLDSEHIVFDVQAPDNEVVNLGSLLTNGGAARMFAGTIRHSGELNADGLRVDAKGRVQLFAQADIHLEAGATLNASGADGGEIEIKSQSGTAWVSAKIEARGHDGEGGRVQITGARVALIDSAALDVSGTHGGGEVLIGGGERGSAVDIRNAAHTHLGTDTRITANALHNGDGGTVIVWADDTTRTHGQISARGGEDSGDGGFVETSGKRYLDVIRAPDIGAPKGSAGTWLLDPENIIITAATDDNIAPSSPFTPQAAGTATLDVITLVDALESGGTVIVDTTGGGGAAGDLSVLAAIVKGAGPDATLDLRAHNDINLSASITSTVGQLNLLLDANQDNVGGGAVNLANVTLDANGGAIAAAAETLNVGAGATVDSDMSVVRLNHSGGTLAGTGTVMVFGDWNPTSGVTLDGTVALGASVDEALSNFTLNGSGTLVNHGALALHNTTFNTGVDNDGGTISVTPLSASNSLSTFNGAVQNRAGSLLEVRSAYVTSNRTAAATIDQGFTNFGTLRLTRADSTTTTTLNVSNGTLLNTGRIETIDIGSGDNVLNAQVTNTGTFDIDRKLTVTNTAGRTFDSSAGTLDIADGIVLELAGDATSNTRIGAGTVFSSTGQLKISGNGSVLALASDVVIPAGTAIIDLGGRDDITVDGPGTLFNSGTLDVEDDTINAALVNRGTVRLVPTEANDAFANLNGTFNNRTDGLLEIRGAYVTSNRNAALTVDQGFTNFGTIRFTRNDSTTTATLNVSNGTLNNAGLVESVNFGSGGNVLNAQVTNSTGTFDIDFPLAISNGGRTFAQAGGTLDIDAGRTLTIDSGTLDWSGGTIGGAGALSLAGGATLGISGVGTRVLDGPTLTGNNLSLAGDSGGSLAIQSGQLNASGTSTIAAGTTVTVSGGTLNATGAVNLEGGTLVAGAGTLNVSPLNINSGTLSGTGTVTGTVNSNGGSIAPGASAGKLVITGDLTLSSASSVDIELEGTNAATPQFDIIEVGGTGTVAGTLNVSLGGGFTPADTDTFTVVTCGTACAGDFDTVNAPADFQTIVSVGAADVVLSDLIAALIRWIGGDGLWNVPALWSTGIVPGAADQAEIDNGGVTVTIPDGFAAFIGDLLLVDELVIDGATASLDVASTLIVDGALAIQNDATLKGAGTVTVNDSGTLGLGRSFINVEQLDVFGQLYMGHGVHLPNALSIKSGGTMTLFPSNVDQEAFGEGTGKLTIESGGRAQILSLEDLNDSFQNSEYVLAWYKFNDLAIDNFGTIEMSGHHAHLLLENGAVFTNRPGGVFKTGSGFFQGVDSSILGGGIFNNEGTIDIVENSSLAFGSKLEFGSFDGTYSAHRNSPLIIRSNSTFSGVTAIGSETYINLRSVESPFDFNSTHTFLDGSEITGDGRGVIADKGARVVVLGQLALNNNPGSSSSNGLGIGFGGTIEGGGTITVFDASSISLRNASLFDVDIINFGRVEVDDATLDSLLLSNHGTVSSSGTILLKNVSKIDNFPGAEFQIVSGLAVDSLSLTGGTFDNQGTIRRTGSAGGGPGQLGANLIVTSTNGVFDGGSASIELLGDSSHSATLSVENGLLVLSGVGATHILQGAVTVNGSGTLVNQGILDIEKDVFNANLDNDGGIIELAVTDGFYPATATINGGFQNRNDGLLTIRSKRLLAGSTFRSQPATLTVAQGFTNEASIQLDNDSGDEPATLKVTNGQVLNAGSISSSINLSPLRPDANVVNAEVTNTGLIAVDRGLQIINSDRVFRSTSGSLDIASGSMLEVLGGTTELGSATNFVSTGLLNITNDIVNLPVDFVGPVLALASDVTIPVGREVIGLDGKVTVNGPGKLINQGTLRITNDTINADLDNVGGHIEVIATSGLINGNLQNRDGGVVEIRADFRGQPNDFRSAVLTLAQGFTNDATLLLDNRTFNRSTRLVVTNGTLNNAGTIQSSNQFSVENVLDAQVTNTGTIDVDSPLQITNTDRTFTTSGGSLDIDEGATLHVVGGTTEIGSDTNFVSSGVLNVAENGSILNLASNVTIPAGSAILGLGGPDTITVNGTGTLINQGNLDIENDIFNASLENDGGLIELAVTNGKYPATATINGGFHNRNDGLVRVRSKYAWTGSGFRSQPATLTVAQGFTNEARIHLSNHSGDERATLNVTNGRLLNAGKIRSTISDASYNFLNAEVTNTGVIDVDGGPLTIGNTDRVFSMSDGTLDLAPGSEITIVRGMFEWQGGTIEGLGNFDLNNGAMLDIAGSGSRVLNGPTLSGSDLALAGAGGSLEIWSGQLDVAGTSTIAAGTTFTVAGGTLNASGALNLEGGELIAGAGTLNVSPLNINAGTLSGNGTVSGTVNNFGGTISPGASAGRLTIAGDLNLAAGSTLDIEIEGVDSAVPQYDVLHVTQSANLDGTLNVAFSGGFNPLYSDTFQVITCGTACNGTFASVAPPAEILTVSTTYGIGEVVIDAFLGRTAQWIAGDGGWDLGANWSGGIAPMAAQQVEIDNGGVIVTIPDGLQVEISNLDLSDTLILDGENTSVVVTDALRMGNGTIGGTGSVITLNFSLIDSSSSGLWVPEINLSMDVGEDFVVPAVSGTGLVNVFGRLSVDTIDGLEIRNHGTYIGEHKQIPGFSDIIDDSFRRKDVIKLNNGAVLYNMPGGSIIYNVSEHPNVILNGGILVALKGLDSDNEFITGDGDLSDRGTFINSGTIRYNFSLLQQDYKSRFNVRNFINDNGVFESTTGVVESPKGAFELSSLASHIESEVRPEHPFFEANLKSGAMEIAAITAELKNGFANRTPQLMRISGETLRLADGASLQGATHLLAGTIETPGSVFFTDGVFSLAGSETLAGGNFHIADTARMTLSSQTVDLSDFSIRITGQLDASQSILRMDASDITLDDGGLFELVHSLLDFKNDGELIKSSGGGGTLSAGVGTLIRKSGGSESGKAQISNDVFVSSNGVAFENLVGTVELQGNSEFAGTVQVTGNPLLLSGDVHSFNGAIIDGDVTASGDNKKLNFEGNVTVSNGTLAVEGGTALGNTIDGGGSGLLAIGDGATLALGGKVFMRGMPFDNSGTVALVDLDTELSLDGGMLFTNSAGGVLDFRANGQSVTTSAGQSVTTSAGARLDNRGTIQRTGSGRGDVQFGSALVLATNTGKFDGQNGAIRVLGNSTHSGALTITGSPLSLDGQNHAFAGNTAISGDIDVNHPGSVLEFSGPVSLENGTLTINGGSTFSGVGELNVALNAAIDAGSIDSIALDGMHIVNDGTFTANNVLLNNDSTITNRLEGVTVLAGNVASDIFRDGTFINFGTIRNDRPTLGLLGSPQAVHFSENVFVQTTNATFDTEHGSIQIEGPNSFSNNLTVTGHPLRLLSDVVTFNGPGSIAGDVRISGGDDQIAFINGRILQKSGTFSLRGTKRLLGGADGEFNIANLGQMKLNTLTLDNIVVTNNGVFDVRGNFGGDGSYAVVSIKGNAELTNKNGGIFSFGENVHVTGAGTFRNQNSFIRKSIENLSSLIIGDYNTEFISENITYDAGNDVPISGAFNSSIAIHGKSSHRGTVEIIDGTTLEFSGTEQTHDFYGGTKINGNLSFKSTDSNYRFFGSTTFENGVFNGSSAKLFAPDNDGVLTVNNSGTLYLSSAVIDGVHVKNSGTLNLSGKDVFGLQPLSVLDLKGGSRIDNLSAGTINIAAGVGFTKSGPNNEITEFFPLTTTIGGSGANDAVIENAGLVRIDLNKEIIAESSLQIVPDDLTGTLVFSPDAVFRNAGGSIALLGGRVRFEGGDFSIGGGTLSGVGVVEANISNLDGTVAPGASPGRLTIDGDYTQGPSGTLEIEIPKKGVAGVDHDLLYVTGNAQLDGALRLLVDGNGVKVGDQFNVMFVEGSKSGDFDTPYEVQPPFFFFSRKSLPASAPFYRIGLDNTTASLSIIDNAQEQVLVLDNQFIDLSPVLTAPGGQGALDPSVEIDPSIYTGELGSGRFGTGTGSKPGASPGSTHPTSDDDSSDEAAPLQTAILIPGIQQLEDEPIQVMFEALDQTAVALAGLISESPPRGLSGKDLAEFNNQTAWLEGVKAKINALEEELQSAIEEAGGELNDEELLDFNLQFLALQDNLEQEAAEFEFSSDTLRRRRNAARAMIQKLR